MFVGWGGRVSKDEQRTHGFCRLKRYRKSNLFFPLAWQHIHSPEFVFILKSINLNCPTQHSLTRNRDDINYQVPVCAKCNDKISLTYTLREELLYGKQCHFPRATWQKAWWAQLGLYSVCSPLHGAMRVSLTNAFIALTLLLPTNCPELR